MEGRIVLIKKDLVTGVLGLSLALFVFPVDAQNLTYPSARRGSQIDYYHGVKVADPYRWLEDDVRSSKEVAEWVAAENRITSKYLEAIPQREKILKRLTELWNYEKYSSPMKEGGRYFFLKNDGLQNQDVLYVMDRLGGPARVVIDPNTWSAEGTKALAGLSFSDDGRYAAYGVAEAGSDWQTWRFLEIESGKLLTDQLNWIKETVVAWTKDGKGVFYSRLEQPPPGAEFHAKNLNSRIFYHRLGTPQADDVLVYALPEHPEWTLFGRVTEDGRYLVITIAKGTDEKYRIAVKDLAEPYGMPVDLITEFKNDYTLVGNDGPVLYFRTDLDAPRRRVIAIDLRQPEPKNYQEIIPQAEATLLDVSLVGNLFIASYLNDVKPQVKLFTTEGKFVREVEFPGIGSVSGFHGKRTDVETFYTFSSFATPPSIYQYDLITGKTTLLRRAAVKFNPDDYEVKQVFYRSKDGTRVPMFLAYKKGLVLGGANPTLLYGYGGFNIPMLPRFSVSILTWMELGGVFAMPNLRGGGEYGEAWHRAGTRLRKQNVFDDFIAAAEWLIDNKYTSPQKLAIQGGSNGGLLVGAVMVQRPELFGACLPAVGVMDMLRFHLYTEGRQWIDDYGSADNPEEFRALYAYSPYQNIKEGVSYPATLVTTADTDDRVVPGHSFKFAAALQRAQAGPAPILIRIETRAGHGAGKPTAKRLEEVADLWAFLIKNLKMAGP
ncbi:MAG: S9 family peptidase [Pirellulales bacterium]|nr:S9 family peptidase [Pirellulales bacterium]